MIPMEIWTERKPQTEGKIYDEGGPGVKEHIQSFINTYQLPLDELLIQDLDQYPVCNTPFKPETNPLTTT